MTSLDLIRFRQSYKWSQITCAQKLGCSPRAIYNWECGITSIPDSIALACSAVAFGLPKYGKDAK